VSRKICRRLDRDALKTEIDSVKAKAKEENLSATTLRAIGILLLVTAACVAILNLKRVADLGMLWLSPVLLVIGIGLVVKARGANKS
jgi:uncharacterized membrane protein